MCENARTCCRLGESGACDVRPLHTWHAQQVQHALHLARASVLAQVRDLHHFRQLQAS